MLKQIAAIALGMSEAQLEEGIQKGTIQSETFLTLMTEQLKVEFKSEQCLYVHSTSIRVLMS